MGGIWGALTWQGKALVIGVALLALLILGLASRHSSDPAAAGQGVPQSGPITTDGSGVQIIASPANGFVPLATGGTAPAAGAVTGAGGNQTPSAPAALPPTAATATALPTP